MSAPSHPYSDNALSNLPFHLTQNKDSSHAVLFLHGLGGGIFELYPLAMAMQKAGHNVVGITYPGHDKTSLLMPSSYWEDWYDHIQTTYDTLLTQYDSVSIIGFSTGSTLALKLAQEKHVHSLALLSPFIKIRHRWYYGLEPERYMDFAPTWLEHVPRRSPAIKCPVNRKQLKSLQLYKTFNLNAVRSALSLIETVKPGLDSITTPTMIIQSREDNIVDPSGAEYILDSIQSAQKEIIWLNNSDHVVTLDTEQHLVFENTLRFIQKSDAS